MGLKRTVMLTIESEDAGPGHARILATDTETGEQMDLVGVTQCTICISPHEPTAVHLEVIPDRVNVAAILEEVQER